MANADKLSHVQTYEATQRDIESRDFSRQNGERQSGASSIRTIYVLFFGTLFILICFLGVCWKMLDVYHVQQSSTTKFHQGLLSKMDILLGDLHRLINRTQAYATEDLCQVRFRLRFADGIEYPGGPHELTLSRSGDRVDKAWTTLDLIHGPIADFGLLPPGEYRLTVTNSWKMACQHDFRVIPGVPVDRAVLCPTRPAWAFCDPPYFVNLHPIWPKEWESKPIIAVYHMEATPAQIGRWHWLPPESQSFHYQVAIARGDPISGARIEAARPGIVRELESETRVLKMSEPLAVPYGDCQISAMSFYWVPLEGRQYRHLQTVRFSSPSFTRKSNTTLTNVTLLDSAPMQHVVNTSKRSPFEVSIPQEIVQQVLKRLEQEAAEV